MQYKALQTINKDGITIAPGQLVDMTDNDARPLLALNVIEPSARPFAKKVDVQNRIPPEDKTPLWK